MRLASYSEKKYWRVCMRFKIFRRWGESGEYLQSIGEVEWCGDGPDTGGTCQSRQESGVDYKNLEPSQWSSPHKSDLLLDLFVDAWNILQREKRHQRPVDDLIRWSGLRNWSLKLKEVADGGTVRCSFFWRRCWSEALHTVKCQFKARAIIKTRSFEVGLNSSWAIIRVRAIISTSFYLLTK